MPFSDKYQARPTEPSLFAVVANLPLAMAISEPGDGKIILLNSAFTDLFGYDATDLAQLADWWRLAYPDATSRRQAQATWDERVRQAEASGKSMSPQEVWVTCKDGSRRYVRIGLARLGGEHVTTFTDLTEQHRSEEALKASESFYRELLERQGDGFGMVDSEERFLVVNPVGEQIFGVAPGQLVGRSLLEFLPPDELEKVQGESRLRQRGDSSTYELEILQADGTPRILLVTATPRSRQGPGPLEVIGVFRDITEQKRAEAALRVSEARYRDQFNLASEGIYTLSPEGDLLEVNAASARMHGYTIPEMLGLKLDDLTSTGSAWMAPSRVRRILAGEAITFQVEHVHKDGHTFPLEVSASLISEGGQPRILVFHRDITERKLAEQALQESEGRFRSYLENAPIGVFICDEWGRYLQVNPAASAITGYSREELLDSSIPDLIPDDWQVPAARHFQELQEYGHANSEMAFTHKDGHQGYWQVEAVRLSDTRFLGFASDITERKLAEEALRESEKRLNDILNTIDAYIFIKDRNYRYTYANRKVCELFGQELDAIIGKEDGSFFGPESLAELRMSDRPVLEQGEPIAREEVLTSAVDGKVRTFWAVKIPLRDENGEIYGLCGNSTDITERKAAQEAVLAASQKLALHFEQTPLGVIEWDTEFRVVRWNPAAERIFGFSAAEALGRHGRFLVPEAFSHAVDDIWTALLEGRGGSQSHNENLRKDGQIIQCSWYNTTLLDSTGRVVGVTSLVEDITEQRRAETALRENEAQLRIIFEASEAGIILVSPKGEITFANRRMAEMFGLSIEELISSPYLSHLHPSELEQSDVRMHMLIRGEIDFVSVERRYVRCDGTEFWGHLSGRRLENSDGSLRALVGIVTDITKRRLAEEEQKNLQAQLHQAQKMESLGSLAGGVAHDMNNVLGAILGLASAHIEAQPPGSPTQRAFGTIIKAAERGGNMLKSLLSFTRQNAAEMRELDLNAILKEEVRLLERTTLSKVRLVMDLAQDLRLIHGDAGALTHAFMNLCVNAVDAMSENGTLTFRSRNLDGGWIEVQVEDTGIGMPKEVMEKALNPFFTTKEVGKGTGLGLSIVYSTVKAHQGQMELQSEPGQGTCVTMRFPACAKSPASVEVSGAYRTMPICGSLKVLLVDDDELIQSSMEGILSLLGHEATLVTSGEQALAVLQSGLRPDVVILDMNMPGLGGAGTLPRLRALRPKLPVLLATGRADQAALDLVAAHPFVTLLAKPFGLKELQASLSPYLG